MREKHHAFGDIIGRPNLPSERRLQLMPELPPFRGRHHAFQPGVSNDDRVTAFTRAAILKSVSMSARTSDGAFVAS